MLDVGVDDVIPSKRFPLWITVLVVGSEPGVDDGVALGGRDLPPSGEDPPARNGLVGKRGGSPNLNQVCARDPDVVIGEFEVQAIGVRGERPGGSVPGYGKMLPTECTSYSARRSGPGQSRLGQNALPPGSTVRDLTCSGKRLVRRPGSRASSDWGARPT